MGLDINPNAYIHILPAIAGFIGPDCVAGILSTNLLKKKDYCLLLDIGTNTEVVLGNRSRNLSCSCASGPAFEGGHIKNGIQAMSGAIEQVKIDPKTMEVSYRTIDNAEPKGLSGSGILSCIAEMIKAGIIDTKGSLKVESNSSRLRTNKNGELEFLISKAGKYSGDIVITQRDIGAVQLAKAAICAGITILMEEMKVKPEQLKHIYIAGAFGNHINADNAITLGMIPAVPVKIVTGVGNAAITGAKMALLSIKARERCEKISNSTGYIELADHPRFGSIYMESLAFPEKKAINAGIP